MVLKVFPKVDDTILVEVALELAVMMQKTIAIMKVAVLEHHCVLVVQAVHPSLMSGEELRVVADIKTV